LKRLASDTSATHARGFRVGIIGTRGIPNRYGGFERFVEVLVENPIWASKGVEFLVYGESSSGAFNRWTRLCNVGFTKSRRPLAYYVDSALDAARECDIVLCCGVGLSFFAFWPVLRGKVLLVNPDGCEWRRTKWSWLGRLLIRAMVTPALAAATRVILDAEALRSDFGRILGRKAHYIAYQAPAPRTAPLSETTRRTLQLTRPFALVIARLEPENSIDLIVRAWHQLRRTDLDLVIVGGTGTTFYQQVLAPQGAPNLRFVGAVYDQQVLDEVRSNCLAYVHGHTVGGTNPSLLEALATVRRPLLCHDNKYNREVAGAHASYFGDAASLAAQLSAAIDSPTQREPTRDDRFHPDTIAARYLALFEESLAAR
jgi:glycosyltransferase involved in cell wall biosynthesis